MAPKKTNVGFQCQGRNLLGFELKITDKADIYMLVFERHHRRLHISYHCDGRLHYKADIPNADSVFVESDYPSGKMSPMIKHQIRPIDVVDRQEFGVTGWGMADVENARLNEFVPEAGDVLIAQPDALSLGFCVNVVGAQAVPRVMRGGDPILERRYVHGVVTLEIEVFDWLTQ